MIVFAQREVPTASPEPIRMAATIRATMPTRIARRVWIRSRQPARRRGSSGERKMRARKERFWAGWIADMLASTLEIDPFGIELCAQDPQLVFCHELGGFQGGY